MGEVLDALLGFVGAIDVDTGVGVGNRTVLGVGSLSHFSVRFCRLERFHASARGIRSAHQILTRIEPRPETPEARGNKRPRQRGPGWITGRLGKFTSFLPSSLLSSLLSLLSCDGAFLSLLPSSLLSLPSCLLSYRYWNSGQMQTRTARGRGQWRTAA